MMPLSYFKSVWRNVVHRDRVERDLDDEVRSAFELLVDDKRRAGMSEADARRAATIELGRVESIKAEVRDVRAGAAWDVLQQDARYGARLLLRTPLVSLTAILSLAVCIGANTAVFTIANRLLFGDPAGVVEPDRLVDIAPARADGSFAEPVVRYSMYLDMRDRLATLEGAYAYQFDLSAMSLRSAAGAERIFGTFVSSSYFSVLRIRPAVGRLVGPQDSEVPGAAPIVVLSHGFWTRRFHADPAVVGQALTINGRPLTIVGVTPEEFHGLSVVVADVWLPANMAETLTPGGVAYAAGGRLRAGVSVSQAAAELDAVSRALYAASPMPAPPVGTRGGDRASRSLRLVGASAIPPVARIAISAYLALLMGIVTLVLVVACTNVAGVLLARATTRRREIAVRLATGAGRSRIVRQLLTETMLLFIVGGAAGVVVARFLTSLIVLALPTLPIPVDTSLPLDSRVMAYTAFATLAAALLSGLVPALYASKADVVSALKADAQGPSDRLRLRSMFVVAQVAFSLVLVISAGLLLRALARSTSVELGFDAQGVEVATLDLSLGGYDATTGPRFVQELLDRLRATPGVSGATAATTLPLRGRTRFCCGVSVPGVMPPSGEPFFQPAWNVIEPGYFAALGIRLLAGRDFTVRDRSGSEPVALISEAAARLFWPGQDPIGRHMSWQRAPRLVSRQQSGVSLEPLRLTVIGLAADVGAGAALPPVLYIPFQQQYQSRVEIAARSSSGQRLTSEIRDAVASINPNLPIVATSHLADHTGPAHVQLRISAAVAGGVGAVGLLLAAIGIFGVTAYAVARRTREIGIRIAMGAQRVDVIRMVLRQGMSLMAIGCGIGLVLAAAASRLFVSLLFGVARMDPVTFGGAIALFSAIGLVACYVPVVRAIRINAVEALRYE